MLEFSKKLSWLNINRAVLTIPNWISYYCGFLTPYPVGYCIISITRRCNLRCKMCFIWEEKPSDDRLNEDNLCELFKSSKILRHAQVVSFSGGEPFLRKDLMNIVSSLFVKTQIKKIVIATNGTMTDRIIDGVRYILSNIPGDKQLIIQFSLDGIGSVHDNIRGVDGTFEKVNATILELTKIRENFSSNLSLSILSIYQPDNKYNFNEVYKYARQKKINFSFNVLNNTEFNKMSKSAYSRKLISKDDIDHLVPQLQERVGYVMGLRDFDLLRQKCFAGYATVYIENDGNVYPCYAVSHLEEFRMGNVLDEGFDGIWKGQTSQRVRTKTKKCSVKGECMVGGCTISARRVQYAILHYFTKWISASHISVYERNGILY